MTSNSFKFPKLSRRHFLQGSSTLAGNVLFSGMTGYDYLGGFANPASDVPWYRQPLRILQTVLRETDALNYDAEAVVSYMIKTHCNTLVVNAGGIVDFFQNPLPGANINRFMQNRDILREITVACQQAGIRVIGRVDFRGVEEQVYRQFPEWFSKNQDGKPVQLDYTRPRLYASCYLGTHRNEHAEKFIRYLLENYALDGIWHNSIGVGGICHCNTCQSTYLIDTGATVPSNNSPVEELDEYMRWKEKIADQHMESMKNTVKSVGSDKVYTAEIFSMFEAGGRIHSGIDLYNARDHFDFLVSVAFLTENSEHIHYEDLSYPGTLIKFLKSLAPEKEAIILYGGNGTAHRYVMDPPVDLKIWLWETLASGGRFWNCSFTGMHPDATHDRRNAFNHSEAYRFVKEQEHKLVNQVPVATVGIYYSKATRSFYRTPSAEEDDFESSIKGMVKVLTAGHIPYDYIIDDQLTSGLLEKYTLVLLPNARCLSEKEMNHLRTYVQSGGHILATFATSLCDIEGKERPDFGLADLFGCQFGGEKVKTRKDCYQYITLPDHPLVREDSDRTELLINAGYTLLCKPAESAIVVCTHVPTVHNQPPEKAWVEKWAQEYPTVIENQFGQGKVLYFTNQPDQVSHEMGHPDMRNLLDRGIRYLSGSTLPLTSTAPESVHIGLTASASAPGQYILSLVNTTSGPGRPVQQLIPVNDITVTLHLPFSALKNYVVLNSAGPCLVELRSDIVHIAIDRLEDFCAISIEME